MSELASDGLHPAAADAVLAPERLAALAATQLVDTEPEVEFDRLTALTARSTGAPISLVALIGSDQSFFKSTYGLPDSVPSRSVPLTHSMCQHVVASGAPLVVDDTRSHPILRDNGAVTDLGAGAYLGIPLRSPSGHVLGTLCAIDVEAREWSPEDITTLLATTAAVQGEITLRAEREARLAAEQMARLKSAFLANMSHEIRTPLTAILGSAEILNDEVPAESRDLTGAILSGGQRLMATLNSVLDLAQIEAGRMSPFPRPTHIATFLTEATRDATQLAAAKGVAFTLDAPSGLPKLILDPGLLDRVVSNLIGNAVKFTEEGRIDVRAWHDGEHLHVEVSDTGIGISSDDLTHLFDEFRQVSDGHDRTYEGNGLGLALVQRVTTLMGGEVSVESVLGMGSRFTASIPALLAVSPASGSV